MAWMQMRFPFLRSEKGEGLVEYALVFGLIVVTAAVTVLGLGDDIVAKLTSIKHALATTGGAN